MISVEGIIGQNRISEIPPIKGQFCYSDHIAYFLKFLRSFGFGKIVAIVEGHLAAADLVERERYSWLKIYAIMLPMS